MKGTKSAFIMLVLWGISSGSMAATLFTDESSFLGALGSYTTDAFETYTVNCSTSAPCSDVSGFDPAHRYADANVESQHNAVGDSYRNFGDYSISTTRVGSAGPTEEPIDAIKISNIPIERSGVHNTTVGGENFLNFDTNISVGSSAHVDFASPVNALGFYFIDNDAGAFTVTVDGIPYVYSEQSDGSALYFGIVLNHPITSFDMDSGPDDSNWAVDDFSYGVTAVPIPAAGILFASALGLLGYSLRRQRGHA